MDRAEALQELGLDDCENTVSPEAVKQAYRSLAKKHHPDKGGDTARFQRIKAAYELLTGETGPDNAHAEMLSRLQELFLAAVEACDEPGSYDIIERLRDSLRHVQRSIASNILDTRRAIRKREQILKRLRYRDGPDSYLHTAILRDIERHKKSVDGLEAEGPKVQTMLDFLDKYGYEITEGGFQERYPTVRGLLGDHY